MTGQTDRDRAQQWLAERLAAIHLDAWGVAPDRAGVNYLTGVARRLLDTPGVEVEEDLVRIMPKEDFEDEPMVVRNPRGMRTTHTQLVIRLPATPTGAAP